MEVTSESVACLGPEGSFSHEFARSHFEKDSKFQFAEKDFDEVISLLIDGHCNFAVIPFLNSNGVHVRPAQIALEKYKNEICVEGCFPHLVRHNLVVTSKFESLRHIASKEQVFPQCENWLRQWSNLIRENATSTSAALRDLLNSSVDRQKTSGVICNTLAHELYGGEILHKNIENPKNTTLFLKLSRNVSSQDERQLLVCLTCPTVSCYKATIHAFAKEGFPLKFTSLNGDFSEKLPFFLQFENVGNRDALNSLLATRHRHLIGSYPDEHSLSTCVASFFDEDY